MISSFLLLNDDVKACLWTEKDLVMRQQRKSVCVLEELSKKTLRNNDRWALDFERPSASISMTIYLIIYTHK